jgi:hypothetical protein
MAISKKAIVLSQARIVLNAEKTNFNGVNFSETTNAPYYVVKGKDASNPFF